MNAKKKPHAKDLVLLPLGGTGEIGMNCYCYGAGSNDDREWLMVDLGVKFGEDSDPGIDVVLPDISFIAKNRKKLSGLVLTHGHEDHIGAVPWLWRQLKCPIYCTPFAAALLNNKLREHGLDEEIKVHIIPLGGRFKVGSFDLEFVNVTHSIPEPCALLIKTSHGTVFHSGDWKIDRTPTFGEGIDEKRLAEIGNEGVDALVCDSTNVLREGFSPSEGDVAATIADIVKHAKGRVAITTFASHVERIASAVRAARANGREVVLAGRAMRNTIEAARACGYLRDAGEFLDEESFGYLPVNKIMLLCTGSQGESRAAIARIGEDQHPHVALEKGDLSEFGRLMNVHWESKKRRSAGMSNSKIDEWYQCALDNGACGGKLIGAGGGGFLMFYAEDKARLRHALRQEGLKEVRFRFDFEGTRIISYD